MADAPKFNLRNPAVKRIMQEIKEVKQDTSGDILAEALETDIFEWHFVIRGPRDTEFEGGIYHGRILLPADYPFKPPSFMMLSPNGRFETSVKICLSISSHHPEHWQPSWSVRTALTALIAFMPTPGGGALGALDFSKEERRVLAARSRKEVPRFGSAERQRVIDDMHARMLAATPSTSASTSAPAAPASTATPGPGSDDGKPAPIAGQPPQSQSQSPPSTSAGAAAAAAASSGSRSGDERAAAAVTEAGEAAGPASRAVAADSPSASLLPSAAAASQQAAAAASPPAASSAPCTSAAAAPAPLAPPSPQTQTCPPPTSTPSASTATTSTSTSAAPNAEVPRWQHTSSGAAAAAAEAVRPTAVRRPQAVAVPAGVTSTDHMLTALMWALYVGIGAILLRKVMGAMGVDLAEMLQ